MNSPINPYGFTPMDRVKWFQVGLLAVAAVLLILGDLLPYARGRAPSLLDHLFGMLSPLLTGVAGLISFYRARRTSPPQEKS
jgi:hypothetical protein